MNLKINSLYQSIDKNQTIISKRNQQTENFNLKTHDKKISEEGAVALKNLHTIYCSIYS